MEIKTKCKTCREETQEATNQKRRESLWRERTERILVQRAQRKWFVY